MYFFYLVTLLSSFPFVSGKEGGEEEGVWVRTRDRLYTTREADAPGQEFEIGIGVFLIFLYLTIYSDF